MKKFNFKQLKFKKVTVDQLNDKLLLLNLYFTQALIFIIGFVWLLFQKQNVISLLTIPEHITTIFLYAITFTGLAILLNVIASKLAPEEANDDGGVNERIFKNRPIWHLIVLCFIIAFCEELLFRGAVQYACGVYWTSVIFSAIHVRYLKHWIPTGLVFCMSYGLGWIYIETGSIWTSIIAHFIYDLAMGLYIRFRRES